MKTLWCTCGQALEGETGDKLYAAVEAHIEEHASRPDEQPDDQRPTPPELDPKGEK